MIFSSSDLEHPLHTARCVFPPIQGVNMLSLGYFMPS